MSLLLAIGLVTLAGVTIAGSSDTTAPTVSITNPAAGTTYTSAQTVTVTANANDNDRVKFVLFYQNGAYRGYDFTAPYTYRWSVTEADNGDHSWFGRAYHASFNYSNSAAVTATVNITPSDTQLPTVAITSPVSGSTYTSAQTVTLTASASDNVGVSKVEFYDGGVLKHTDTTNAYTYSWPVTDADNGAHDFTARAYDAAGNPAIFSGVTLTVDIAAPDTTPPTVVITSPASGATYTSAQTVTLTAAASDNVGVTEVRFYDNGSFKGRDTTAPYTYSWAVSEGDNGTHNCTARAYDAAGNSASSQAVELTVDIQTLVGGDGEHLWSRGFGGSRSDRGFGVAVDQGNGDVVLTGSIIGSMDFGGGSLCTDDIWTANAVVARYTAAGAHLWSVCIDGSAGGTPRGQAVAVDGVGNVVVTGDFRETVDFGGETVTAEDTYDFFVAKYSNWGELLWVNPVDSGRQDLGLDIAFDSADNIVVTAYYAQPDAIVLAKYSPSGALQWERRFRGLGNNRARGIAIDAEDNIVITGDFINTLDFGGGSLTSVGYAENGFVAKFTPQGTHLWSKQFGVDARFGYGPTFSFGIAVDGVTDDVVVVGHFQGTLNLGGRSLVSAGSEDMFVVKFRGTTGAHLWSDRFGGTAGDRFHNVAVDPDGNVVAVGRFASQSVDLGGGTLENQVSSLPTTDVAVAKYTADGVHLWSQAFGGSNYDDVWDVAVSADADISVTGHFQGAADFSGVPLTPAGGSDDIFMVTFGP